MTETLSYQHATLRSKEAYQRALAMIPGGVQGNIKFYQPYPLSFATANGPWLHDVDGNAYVDYLLSFGALILGHGHPVVRKAVEEVWSIYGTSSFGVPYPLEQTMAATIQKLYHSVEQVRFTNSGLEATLLAIRIGMAYTGRPTIAKFSGHYHGGHEHVLVSTKATDGDGTQLPKVAESLHLPDYFLDHTEILPFNDIERCSHILRNTKDKIAAVILEPFQNGYIPADGEFMRKLRELTTELGIVLIFDEVKTGFRIRLGGAQEFFGVSPDLTALGKVLGGGFPVGAVGGRKEMLELMSPGFSNNPQEVVFHSGTFNGNPISLLSGLRTIEHLQEAGNYESLLKTTKQLRDGIEYLAKTYQFPLRTVGEGTIFNVVFTDSSLPLEPRDMVKHELRPPHQQLRGQLDFLLMRHGVFSKPYNRFSVSLSHDETAIDATLDAFEKSFAALRKI